MSHSWLSTMYASRRQMRKAVAGRSTSTDNLVRALRVDLQQRDAMYQKLLRVKVGLLSA
jgi:hypothetical protein